MEILGVFLPLNSNYIVYRIQKQICRQDLKLMYFVESMDTLSNAIRYV